jgi:hypothetical protein
MLTVKQIEDEASQLREQLRHATSGKAKLNARPVFLKQCKYYIETAPRPEYLQAQYATIKERLDIITSRFGTWCAHRTGGASELQRQYNTENDVAKLKAQLKALKYLIN